MARVDDMTKNTQAFSLLVGRLQHIFNLITTKYSIISFILQDNMSIMISSISRKRQAASTVLMSIKTLQVQRQELFLYQGGCQLRCFTSTLPKRKSDFNKTRNSNGSNDNENENMIRPYSGSLPSPGHEWCSRCHIPDKCLQKRIGYHNPCLDTPRLFGFGLCQPAWNFYKRQTYTLTFILGICIIVEGCS